MTARADAARRARGANWLALYWRRFNPSIARAWRERRDEHMAAARNA